MSRKSIFALVVIAVLVGISAYTVLAQDTPTTPPFGRGMMGSGFGGMMWGNDESMMADAAAALGLEPQAFIEAIRSGKTLAEIAEAQGIELQTVYDAMIARAEAHMAAAVAAGTVTQAQADEHLTWMREHVSEMPMFSGAGTGPCMESGMAADMGMMGHGRGMMGRGSGMMGNGRGMWGNNS